MSTSELIPIIEASSLSVTTDEPATIAKREEMESTFLKFTDDHKKILNTMVRNNPALMSGSFSILVHNPKVLEFDNKRSYFFSVSFVFFFILLILFNSSYLKYSWTVHTIYSVCMIEVRGRGIIMVHCKSM